MNTDLKYKVYDYADNLIPGQELKIHHTVYAHEEASKTYVPNILHNRSMDEIDEEIEFGIAREKQLFENLKKAIKEWENQAALTAYFKEAREFFKLKPIEHTGNKWTRIDESNYTQKRSNAVYEMFYRISVYTKWDEEKNDTVPFKYFLHWDLFAHAPYIERYNTALKRYIAGQEKTFKTKEEMEKYLAGRIKAYDHLFQEEYPVVPKEYAEMFMFHGMVKPGYKIAEE